MRHRVIRDVTQKECFWLEKTIKKGTIVYECNRATYGCVSYRGIAATFRSDGDYPFFELPKDAVQKDFVES